MTEKRKDLSVAKKVCRGWVQGKSKEELNEFARGVAKDGAAFYTALKKGVKKELLWEKEGQSCNARVYRIQVGDDLHCGVWFSAAQVPERSFAVVMGQKDAAELADILRMVFEED